LSLQLIATAYIFGSIFEEYQYHPEKTPDREDGGEEEEEPSSSLEIPLNTLTDCLNIFGTAGAPSLSTFPKHKQWRRADDNDDRDRDDNNNDDAPQNRGGHRQATTTNGGFRIDQYFSGSEKRTGMRMSYAGPGHPLTLLL
jgi:cell cycle checkpoint protein